MKNCALIEELRLTIGDELNILTGETGAGKSIIIDALNLSLGNKYDRTFLRKGTEKGIVEVVFQTSNENVVKFLKENDIDFDEDNLVILTRTFFDDGKSNAKINGRTVRIATLKQLSSLLVDVHGQHQNNALLNVETHIDYLDLFGGEKIDFFKNEYSNIYSKFKSLKRELNKLNDNKDEKEIEREIDLIKFQIDEIAEADLSEEEYEELLKRREIVRNSEKIYEKLNKAYFELGGGQINAVDLICSASSDLSNLCDYDSELGTLSNDIDRISFELQDIVSSIGRYMDKTNFEPDELDRIEYRVDEINNLRRKYGNTISDIFKYYAKISKRLKLILNRDEKVLELKSEIEKVEKVLEEKASNLTSARVESAKELENLLIKELESLEMKNVKFEVKVTESDFDEKGKDRVEFIFGTEGKDKIEFMVSFNLGEDMKPINKVASGGEMSRFMLAFKTILADIDGTETLIFDEIDTGISGVAAQIVGEKLRNIAKKKQIICITHLSQIAVNATTHFLIEKSIKEDRTVTNIKKLSDEDRIKEIARLIAGKNITSKTIENAKEMIKRI
jgi:DNA repair protein RecN (Recombination protein N)